MLPEGLYKRRHYDTPSTFILLMINIVAVGVLISFFPHHTTNWFFWTAIGLLAVYNVFDIRKNRELYNRINIISYVVTMVVLVLLYVFL